MYEKVVFETQANKISPLVVNPGRILLTSSRIYFQPYNNVESVSCHYRLFLGYSLKYIFLVSSIKNQFKGYNKNNMQKIFAQTSWNRNLL